MLLIFVCRGQSGIARKEHRNSAENAVERQQKCLYYRSHLASMQGNGS
jgi:hypothetical protein